MRSSKDSSFDSSFLLAVCLGVALATLTPSITARAVTDQAATPQTTTPQDPAATKKSASPDIPRGTKLVLTDGTFQVVREYQRNGERVRYFSMERGDWEEIPAAMIDWDATAKAKTANEQDSADLVAKVHSREEAKRMDNMQDIDASLPVGDGAYLPQGEGMFVVEGKSIRLVLQVDAAMKTDKKREIERVLSPIPVVPGKKHMEIAGTRAALRVSTKTPEFYLRESPQDLEHETTTTVRTSSRPGENGPDIELLRAKVTRSGRQFETIRALFGEVIARDANEVSVQRWEVAPRVYRFTLAEALPPGEYVLTEVLPDGLNMYVWDFGVDAPASAANAPAKK